jgi:enoyl-CoA hydratase/carnithine racemase
MPVLSWKKDDSVGIIEMHNGENRHNPDFVREILTAFDEIEQDPGHSSVILASTDPKNWSLGIDMQWIGQAMAAGDADAVRAFLYGLNRLYTRILLYPLPVIAAIGGHAFGGGAIIACACDFRLMKADRGYFCFPEIDIRIPFLPGMLAILAKALPTYKLEELVFSGKKCGAPELADHHVLVRACPDASALMQDSLALAKTFAKPRTSFAEMKRRLHGKIIEVMEKEDPAYIEPLRLML